MPLYTDRNSKHYQNLVNLDHPLIPFLVYNMAFSSISETFAVNIEKVEVSPTTFLIADFVAVLVGLRSGVTPLQSFFLVLPLSRVSVFTVIIIFKAPGARLPRETKSHFNIERVIGT